MLFVGVQPLSDIDEVNMFKDDNTVVHFKRPLSKKYLQFLTFIFLSKKRESFCSHSYSFTYYVVFMCINLFFVVQFSVRENLLVVTGNPETKELKDLMPEILKQVGVQQYNYLKNIIGNMDTVKESKAGEEDEDDVPDLVGTNFEEASKK